MVLATTLTAEATTYTIHADGSGDFPTIQQGLQAAFDGDIIELSDGTFVGEGNRDLDFLGKLITLRSTGGDPTACTIDCEGSESDPHRGINCISGEPLGTKVAGITIRNGWVTLPEHGGAINCDHDSALEITDCFFAGNQDAAIYAGHNSILTLTDCEFAGNQAHWGGGIRCSSITLTMDRCSFVENTAENQGGGLFAFHVDAILRDCVFRENHAQVAGGANFEEMSDVALEDCVFEGNEAEYTAGGVSFFVGCISTLDRCTFAGNVAGGSGSALFSEKISDTWARNCTFWGNSAPNGTILAGHMQVRLDNCLLCFETIGPAVSSYYDYAELTCCDLFGNAGGDWVGTIADQYGLHGNIAENPLLCDPENGDFMLDEASPCTPFSDPNPECDLIGAYPVGCGNTPVTGTTWGGIKALFRD